MLLNIYIYMTEVDIMINDAQRIGFVGKILTGNHPCPA